ncbi:MAG: hypothetical protein WCI05_16085, partial [Myxococcales bacterium]
MISIWTWFRRRSVLGVVRASSVEHLRAGPSSNALVRLQARWASGNDATPTASSQIFARVRRAYVEPAWRRTSSHGGWQAGTADIDLAEPPLSSL